jgi:hypothetical protein
MATIIANNHTTTHPRTYAPPHRHTHHTTETATIEGSGTAKVGTTDINKPPTYNIARIDPLFVVRIISRLFTLHRAVVQTRHRSRAKAGIGLSCNENIQTPDKLGV